MEREIKFRGMRTDKREWIYGYYWKSPKSEYDKSYIIETYTIPSTHHTNAKLLTKSIEVIPESIGQFTGLKDKNGKEIYEGDIMVYSIIMCCSDKKRIGEKEYAYIKWLDKEAKFVHAFSNPDDDYGMSNETMKSKEIIGNKFQNPELLK